MDSKMVHFLIVFDHGKNELLQADPFIDAQEAAQRYSELEERLKDAKGLEIVLVGSDSIETIHRTHGHYFDRDATKPHNRYLVDV